MRDINHNKSGLPSADSLDRLFLQILPQITMPESIDSKEIEFALRQKIQKSEKSQQKKDSLHRKIEQEYQKLHEDKIHKSTVAEIAIRITDNDSEPRKKVDRSRDEDLQIYTPDKIQFSPATIDDSREGADEARRIVQSFLKGSVSITYIDPYLFQFRATDFFRTESEYVNAVCNLIPASVVRLTFVAPSFKATVKSAIQDRLKDGRHYRWLNSDRFHDRVFLRDNSEGMTVGTSFGGFGSKIFIINQLEKSDVESIKSYLYDIIQG